MRFTNRHVWGNHRSVCLIDNATSIFDQCEYIYIYICASMYRGVRAIISTLNRAKSAVSDVFILMPLQLQ